MKGFAPHTPHQIHAELHSHRLGTSLHHHLDHHSPRDHVGSQQGLDPDPSGKGNPLPRYPIWIRALHPRVRPITDPCPVYSSAAPSYILAVCIRTPWASKKIALPDESAGALRAFFPRPSVQSDLLLDAIPRLR